MIKLSFFDLHLVILASALILDYFIGDPDWLWRRIPHPITFFGALIHKADEMLNLDKYNDSLRKQYGIATILILCFISILIGWLLSALSPIIEAITLFIFLAAKSLLDHLKAVFLPLRRGDLEASRKAVAMIVGRNTIDMNQSDVSRAAIESGAENLSDGFVAPIFWFLIGGLPLLICYKMVNTADSMIGYKSDKYLNFGYGAAKLDDALNYFPARICGALIVIAGGIYRRSVSTSWKIMIRDGRLHESPNAGIPEAAMAGALGVALGGPRTYGEALYQAPWINPEGEKSLSYKHLQKAILIIHIVVVILIFSILGIIGLFSPFWLIS